MLGLVLPGTDVTPHGPSDTHRVGYATTFNGIYFGDLIDLLSITMTIGVDPPLFDEG